MNRNNRIPTAKAVGIFDFFQIVHHALFRWQGRINDNRTDVHKVVLVDLLYILLTHTGQRVTTNHSVLLSELKEDGIVCCQKWVITDGCWHSSTGFPPPRGSHTAMLVACDALNARTTTAREYHCPACTLSPASCHTCFTALCFSLRFSRREKPHGAPAARLGTDRMCPFCPMMHRRYLAGIFVKVQACGQRVGGNVERE